MRISLMNELTGIKVYQSSPVWQLDKEIATVDLSDTENADLFECKNGNTVLRIDEGDGRVLMIGFKRGTTIDANGRYTIGRFVADRDYHEGDVNITVGAVKYMVY